MDTQHPAVQPIDHLLTGKAAIAEQHPVIGCTAGNHPLEDISGNHPLEHISENLEHIATNASNHIAPAAEMTDQIETFVCEWDTCCTKFDSLKLLVIHVNAHVAAIDWDDKSVEQRCRWQGCWNTHSFQYKIRMVEHLRAHTLEKPFICPVKTCGCSFAIRSNCLAHGRTRHNRSFKPIFIDITKDDLLPDDLPLEEEEYDDEMDDYDDLLKMEPRLRRKFAEKRFKRPEKPTGPLSKQQRLLRELKNMEDRRKSCEEYNQWIDYMSSKSQESLVLSSNSGEIQYSCQSPPTL
jgi:hypothetical protein